MEGPQDTVQIRGGSILMGSEDFCPEESCVQRVEVDDRDRKASKACARRDPSASSGIACRLATV